MKILYINAKHFTYSASCQQIYHMISLLISRVSAYKWEILNQRVKMEMGAIDNLRGMLVAWRDDFGFEDQ